MILCRSWILSHRSRSLNPACSRPRIQAGDRTMGHAKRAKDKNWLPPFVPIIWEVLNSKAYIDIPYAARSALPYFLGKVHKGPRDPDRYTLDFKFPYPEAKRLGFSNSTFANIIRYLMEFGFIDPVEKGGLRGQGKSCSRFRLSTRWEQYGTPDFKAVRWRSFVQGPKIKATPIDEQDNTSF